VGIFLVLEQWKEELKVLLLLKAPLEIIQATYDVSFSPSIEIALQICPGKTGVVSWIQIMKVA
jgi:hypothetical protein